MCYKKSSKIAKSKKETSLFPRLSKTPMLLDITFKEYTATPIVEESNVVDEWTLQTQRILAQMHIDRAVKANKKQRRQAIVGAMLLETELRKIKKVA